MSSATALTVIQQSLAPVHSLRPAGPIPRPPNPANDRFPNYFQQRPQKHPVAGNDDEIEQGKRGAASRASFVRDRRRPEVDDQKPRRRDEDYRQPGRKPPSVVHAESGFVAQFIAQEIIPGEGRPASGPMTSGVSAYEASNERNEIYADPYQAVNQPA